MMDFGKAGCALLAMALATTPLAAKRPAAPAATARLFTATGTDAGYAVIVARKDKAVLRLSLRGVTPGEHGMHFHTVGSCKGTAFADAGGHLNPEGKMHGMKNPAGSHLGDLPNVVADANGFAVTVIPLAGSAKSLFTQMFDADGTALVIHAGADDYVTDPSGNSGARVACGVIKKN